MARKALVGVAVLFSLLGWPALAGTAQLAGAIQAISFSTPVFVDPVRAGGEPLVIHSTKVGDLVYSSHEGTTHLDRSGLPSSSTVGFFCPGALEPTVPQPCYENHVWVWTSTDLGKTWTFRDEGVQYTGFSDPDLTEDASGAIYDTGIDLANDAVFSSQDGGVTWPHGTAQCHEGDRPWLAGGKAGEVFMTTDADQTNGSTLHTLFYSSNYADSCSSNGIADVGPWQGSGNYSGFGKGVYDPVDGSFIEPAQFNNADGTFGVGYSRLPNAAAAFTGGGAFQPVEVDRNTSVYSPFGAPNVMTMDRQENLYFAWDTNERIPNTTNGCGSQPNQPGGPTPKPNHIMFEVGRHTGPGQWQWSTPIALESYGPAKIAGAHVEWPWSVVGTPGNVSIVWYQMDQLVDPDCDIAASSGQPAPNVNTFIYEAHISGALDPATRQITVTNASGRAIHQGGICDSGTTCAATGQDRRLGDYFSNSIDGNGCVIIASGDTTVPDAVTGGPRITSLPIFQRQQSGPSLTGQVCGPSTPSIGAPGASGGGTPNTSADGIRPSLRLLWVAAIAAIITAVGAVTLLGRRGSA